MMTPGEAQHEQPKEKKTKDHNESAMLFDNDQSMSCLQDQKVAIMH